MTQTLAQRALNGRQTIAPTASTAPILRASLAAWSLAALAVLMVATPVQAQTATASEENANASTIVKLSQAQQTAFAMRFSELQAVKQRLSFAYSGLVGSPATQLNTLSAPAEGLVVKVFKTQGAVTAGEPIIELQSVALLETQQAWLSHHGALRLAQSDYQRAQDLLKSGVVSQKQVAQAQAQVQTLQHSSQQMMQTLSLQGMSAASMARLQQTLRLQPATVLLQAPSQGTLLAVNVRAGERVALGQSLVQLNALSSQNDRVVDVHVPLEQVSALQVGQALRLWPQLDPVQGEVSLIDSTVNPLNQTVRVQSRLSADALHQLRPGTLVQVAFVVPLNSADLGESGYAYQVDTSAVVKVAGQSVVFVRQTQQPEQLVMHAVQAYEQPLLEGTVSQTVIVTTKPLSDAQIVTQGLTAVLGVLAAMSDSEGAQ
jgi:multidrug efflux pump subunit AcrA (membrane-fusion protein)